MVRFYLRKLLPILILLIGPRLHAQTITTVAGGIGDGMNGLLYAKMGLPQGIVYDGGSIYIGDILNSRLRKYDLATGVIHTMFEGISVRGLMVDAAHNIYVSHDHRVSKINATTGVMTVIAGTGSGGFTGDGSLATAATLNGTGGLAMDASGNIYVVDVNNSRVRKINTAGMITTVAGGGTGGDGSLAVLASLNAPNNIEVDAGGNLIISSFGGLRKVNTSGVISTLAASVRGSGMTKDNVGNFYVGDFYAHRIYKITPSGTITVFAGGSGAFTGDGGPATAAGLDGAFGATFDNSGTLYFTDYGNRRVRSVNTAGIINTVVGNAMPTTGFSGDGGPALLALTGNIAALATDVAGNVYVADQDNQRIRKISTAGIITTYAGNGITGFLGDGGSATAAALQNPGGIAFDRNGNCYIADYGSNRVRKVNTAGIINTVAGGGTSGLGEGGPATSANITPSTVCTDTAGNVYLIDMANRRARKIDASTGIITTIAGNGSGGYAGDNGPATAASLDNPTSICVDRKGRIYVVDDNKVRRIDNNGVISRYAGGGTLSILEGEPAYLSSTGIVKIAIDRNDNLYATSLNAYVYRIDTFGYLHFAAGNGNWGYLGSGIPAASAEVYQPNAVVVDTAGNVFFGDMYASVSKLCCFPNYVDYPPLFTHGNSPSMTICQSSGPIVLDSFYTIRDGDVGDHEQWTVFSAPVHGTLSGFPDSTISTGGAITRSGFRYTPAPGFSGIDNFTIKVSDGIDFTLAQMTVSVTPLPTANVYGPTSVCAADSILLTGSPAGGVWGVSNANATISSVGRLHAITAGRDTATYTVTNSCGVTTATRVITINPLPVVAPITGDSALCTGSSTILSDSTFGGAWYSSSPFISVTSGGLVIGFASGTATVTYTISSVCGTASTTKALTINSPGSAGTITGATTLCTLGTTTLSDAVPGGVWSSGNPFIATVDSTGVVTGVSAGSAIISYSITSGCGPASAIAIVNVTSATPILPVTGPSVVCSGSNITLHDASSGGTWSSSNPAIATVGSAGVVTGVSAGVAAISYMASLGCGTSLATLNITVHAAPDAGSVTGPATLCQGAMDVVSSYIAGGTWSASNGHLTVSTTGIITGISSGADTLTYSVTNSCGTDTATRIVTVYPAPLPGTIIGSSSQCAGSAITLTDAATGGVWSSSNTTVASVGSTGIVFGLSRGLAVISYTATTGCGSASATKSVTVNAPDAGTITGVTTLCAGGTSTLSDSATGGVWSSSAPAVATVSSTGIVHALAGGASVISYSVTTGCGTAVATAVITVGSLPVVSPIAGTFNICSGTASLLTDATLSGVWSSSDTSVATIDSVGNAHGIREGVATISYIVTAGCGASGATASMHVYSMPVAATLSGSHTVCERGNTMLAAGTSGGAWNSSDATIATIGSVSGIMNGVNSGNVMITYALTNTCGTALSTYSVHVDPLPNAGTIYGLSEVCSGAMAAMYDAMAGGVWQSSNAAVAGVDSVTGIVAGVATGSAIISYAVTNGCGTTTATKTIAVTPLPNAGTVSGVSSLCVGSAAIFTDVARSGLWHSSDPLIASVSIGGTVTGMGTGAATIYYEVTNSCGSAVASKSVSVQTPDAGTITGVTVLCAGNTAHLSSTVPGGLWMSSDTAVATIDTAGMMTAIAPGNTIISYTVTDGCGTAVAIRRIGVGSLPVVGTITGNNTICKGTSTNLADGTTGGVWSSGSPSVATVDSTGKVTGVSAGTATISYMLTAGCGTAGATFNIHIEDMPVAASITGESTLCRFKTTTLHANIPNGVWTSGDGLIATIGRNNGIVAAIETGSVIMSYTLTNSCGSASSTFTETIITIPDAGTISGSFNVCEGAQITMSDNVLSGVWSSSNGHIATINSIGTLTGITPGTAIISYQVTNICGSNTAVATVDVNMLPYVGPVTGNTSIKTGRFTVLRNAVPGGIWSSGNAAIAGVSQDGVVTGNANGDAEIMYTVYNMYGCAGNAATTVHVGAGDGNGNAGGIFDMYPNPASYEVMITWEDQYATFAEVTLSDMSGKILSTQTMLMPTSTGKSPFKLNGLASGIYTINIKAAGNFYTKKLVIAK